MYKYNEPFVYRYFKSRKPLTLQYIQSRYRSEPVAGTGATYRGGCSHYGVSNKGLISASYRKAIDYQVLSYNENTNEHNYIKFIHRKSIETYIDSGAIYMDYPRRNRPRRTWKRSKKKHQWSKIRT